MKVIPILLILVVFFSFNVVFIKETEAVMQVAQGSFAKTTTAGSPSQSITTVGFQPKAVIFYYANSTAEGFSAGQKIGFGFANDSTNEGGVAIVSDDAAARQDAARVRSGNRSILIIRDGSDTAVEAEGNVTSFDVNGFTIGKSDPPAANTVILYLAIKGGQYNVSNFTGE